MRGNIDSEGGSFACLLTLSISVIPLLVLPLPPPLSPHRSLSAALGGSPWVSPSFGGFSCLSPCMCSGAAASHPSPQTNLPPQPAALTHLRQSNTHTHTHTCTHAQTHTHTHTHTHMHRHIHTHAQAHTHTHTHARTHTHTHTHTIYRYLQTVQIHHCSKKSSQVIIAHCCYIFNQVCIHCTYIIYMYV